MQYTIHSPMVGMAINKLQAYLNFLQTKGLITRKVTIDGIFGTDTKNVVFAFQSAIGIPATGVVDARTWDCLLEQIYYYEASLDVPNASSLYALKLGMRGLEVLKLQEYLSLVLRKIGLQETIVMHGIYDEQTKRIVSLYQAYFHLEKSGQINAQMWDHVIKTYHQYKRG